MEILVIAFIIWLKCHKTFVEKVICALFALIYVVIGLQGPMTPQNTIRLFDV